MSTYWGFHCKTCPQGAEGFDEDDQRVATSIPWMNHGEKTLRDIARLAPHFKAIWKGDSTGCIEMAVLAHGGNPIYWVIDHAGHDIELQNEYGDTEPIDAPAPAFLPSPGGR